MIGYAFNRLGVGLELRFTVKRKSKSRIKSFKKGKNCNKQFS